MAEERQIIITPYARLSFPKLAKAEAFKKGDDEKFSASFLFPKAESIGKDRDDDLPFSPWGDFKNHDLSVLEKIIDQYVEDTWPNKKKRPAKLKLPFKDGDDEKWGGYEGHVFIRTSSQRAPKIIDARKNEVTGDDIEKMFYAGCWVRAIVNPFDYSNAGNVGVSFGLQAVQFIRDDEPFSGGINAQEAFDDLPDADLAPADIDDLE